MLGLAHFAPFNYRALVQEDRFVEWWTACLFLAAATTLLRHSFPRRFFDLLVAAFCIFVAGEEISWGQRLLGFTPPDLFLERNTQQELTLHNFADWFGQPKTVLMLALCGYGLLLPLLARWRRAAPVLERVGATAPPVSLTPWFAAATVLLYWYPVEFTGEWVEALAGVLFFASARPLPRWLLGGVTTTALAALALTLVSARGTRASPAALACAQRETQALVEDLQSGAATSKLLGREGTVHKRVWTAIDDRYVYRDRLTHFQAASCGSDSQYLVDPWGIAYWLRVLPQLNGTQWVSVYSMGPNRRRDHSPNSAAAGDDIIATGVVAVSSNR